MYWAMAAQAASQFGQAIFAGPQAPQVSSNQPFNPFTVDNSGWSVNFGSGTSSAQPNPVSTLAQGLANGANNATGALSDPLVLIAVVGLFMVMRK